MLYWFFFEWNTSEDSNNLRRPSTRYFIFVPDTIRLERFFYNHRSYGKININVRVVNTNRLGNIAVDVATVIRNMDDTCCWVADHGFCLPNRLAAVLNTRPTTTSIDCSECSNNGNGRWMSSEMCSVTIESHLTFDFTWTRSWIQFV